MVSEVTPAGTVKVCTAPVKLKVVTTGTAGAGVVMLGVTVMVAVFGALVALVPVKAAILPVPLAPRPMVVLLFVHAYVTVPPVVGVVKLVAAKEVLLHTTWLAGWLTCGVGLTVIVNVLVGPGHGTPAAATA
jgi:hypothetical protein